MDVFTCIVSRVPGLMPGAATRIERKDAIALTIDDGPDPEATPAALHALDKHSMTATFFFNGECVQKYPSCVRACHREGHGTANHGFGHKSLLLRRGESIREQLQKTNDEIAECTNSLPVFFRPPYGRWNPLRSPILHSMDLSLILWSLMPGDFRADFDERRMRTRLKDCIRPGDILVLHANEKTRRVIAPLISIVADVLSEKRLLAAPLSRADIQKCSR
jgi:peptidoglycan/xylan/chitin deacetylase (PgdA/CDA1 family)